LRQYWQGYRPVQPWLFPQRSKPLPMDPTTAQKMYYAAKRRAGITKGCVRNGPDREQVLQ
jgi:integrase/recombinase XerD